ncbi:MAG: bacterial transcriptional activator domain-containing protein [Candidatus Sumerlaeia bacterium]|nr:bacterial transcriptional activator domain-containing protein [Candidatus Sumerlaeia bacterium]
MLKNSPRYFHFLTALLLCLSVTTAQADGLLPPAMSPLGVKNDTLDRYKAPVFTETVQCNGIDRQIAVLNTELVTGEPVLFRMIVTNSNPRMSREFMANMSFGNDVRVIVYPARQLRIPQYEYVGIPRGATGATASLDMEGIGMYRFDFRMAFDQDTVSGASFDIPGQYRLEFIHNCISAEASARRTMNLGTVDITVRAAEGQDARAAELLNDPRAYRALQLHAARDLDRTTLLTPPVVERFRRIVEELPEARVRPHVAITLADHYLLNRNHDECIALLELIRRDYPGTPHDEMAAYQLLPLYRGHRSVDKARELYHSMWADASLTQLLNPNNDNFVRYVTPWLSKLSTPGTQWMLFPKPGPDPMLGEEEEGPTLIVPEELQRALGVPGVITPDVHRQLMQDMEHLLPPAR